MNDSTDWQSSRLAHELKPGWGYGLMDETPGEVDNNRPDIIHTILHVQLLHESDHQVQDTKYLHKSSVPERSPKEDERLVTKTYQTALSVTLHEANKHEPHEPRQKADESCGCQGAKLPYHPWPHPWPRRVAVSFGKLLISSIRTNLFLALHSTILDSATI